MIAWLMALTVGPLIVLGFFEVGLRAAGFGHSTGFLMKKEVNGRTFHVPNKAFYKQFSRLPVDRTMTWDDLDFQAPVRKGGGVFRVVVFGGSAAYGPRSFARILEVMLRGRFPEIRFEFYNTACPGMNSHVMWAAARACRTLEPDVFLIYMGNNEMIGPFGPTTRIAARPWLWRPAVIRALILASDFRIVQLCAGTRQERWQAPDDTASLLSQMGFMYHQKANAHHLANLQAMCAYARDAGAVPLVCTLAQNRRTGGEAQPPEPDLGKGFSINGNIRWLGTEERDVCLVDVEAALAEASPDGFPGYEYFYDAVHFTFGGNYVAACAIFDALVRRFPAWRRHDNGERVEPLPKEECARRLAWTPAAEFEKLGYQLQAVFDAEAMGILQQRYERLSERLEPDWHRVLAEDYRRALESNEADWLLRHKYVEALLAAGDAAEAERQARILVEGFPQARVSYRDLGHALRAMGDARGAIDALRKTLALYADDYNTCGDLAGLLTAQGLLEEAEALYRTYLEVDPMNVYVMCNLGEVLEKRGDREGARNAYSAAIDIEPGNALPYTKLDALLAPDTGPDARAAFWRGMAREQPGVAPPCVQLGVALEAQGDARGALEAYRDAVRRSPSDAAAHLALVNALARAGDLRGAVNTLQDALGRMPDAAFLRPRLIELFCEVGDYAGAGRALDECRKRHVAVPAHILNEVQQHSATAEMTGIDRHAEPPEE